MAETPMDQLNPKTGLTWDFMNEALLIPGEIGTSKAEGLEERDWRFPRLKRYAERYDPERYSGVITEQNREAVKQLDRIVDDLNFMIDSENRCYPIMVMLCEEIERIIRGSD